MEKVTAVLNKIISFAAGILKTAWAIVVKFAPIIWAAVCLAAKVVWKAVCTFAKLAKNFICVYAKKIWAWCMAKTGKLLGIDEFANKRAVTITLCSFIAVIVLLLIVIFD